MVNREGEPVMLCHVELTVDAQPVEIDEALDPVLEHGGDGMWTELWTEPGGEQIVRGTVRWEDGRVVIDANSEDRVQRLLDTVVGALPGADVVVDERTSPRQAMAEGPGPLAGQPVPPELQGALDDYLRQMEAEWIDESIPALGGLTPRQARDDPTRREDLDALLRELDASAVPAGGGGFDAGRIRKLLEID
jgi:hypothetical protein